MYVCVCVLCMFIVILFFCCNWHFIHWFILIFSNAPYLQQLYEFHSILIKFMSKLQFYILFAILIQIQIKFRNCGGMLATFSVQFWMVHHPDGNQHILKAEKKARREIRREVKKIMTHKYIKVRPSKTDLAVLRLFPVISELTDLYTLSSHKLQGVSFSETCAVSHCCMRSTLITPEVQ